MILFFLELYFQAMGRLNTKLLFLNSLGTLEDWDAAVQKTENRLARVNEQRAKVRTLNYKQFIGNTYFKINLDCQISNVALYR